MTSITALKPYWFLTVIGTGLLSLLLNLSGNILRAETPSLLLYSIIRSINNRTAIIIVIIQANEKNPENQ